MEAEEESEPCLWRCERHAHALSDDNFSKGDTATATIPLDGETPPAFFKAKIEEK